MQKNPQEDMEAYWDGTWVEWMGPWGGVGGTSAHMGGAILSMPQQAAWLWEWQHIHRIHDPSKARTKYLLKLPTYWVEGQDSIGIKDLQLFRVFSVASIKLDDNSNIVTRSFIVWKLGNIFQVTH